MRARFAGSVAWLVVLAGCSAPSSASITLRVLLADDWASVAPVVDAVRDFERAHPNVTVEIEPVQFEFVADVVRDAIDRGAPPDVVQFHAFAAGATGMAQPIDDLWTNGLDAADFLPGAIEDITWAGKRYGVPLDANAMAILYNVDALADAGVAPPADPYGFDRLMSLAARVTSSEHVAFGFPSSTWAAYGWIRSNGGEVVSADGNGDPVFTFDRPENIEALGFLGDLVRRGYAQPPIGRLGDRIDAFALFRSGSAVFHATGSWDIASLADEPLAWGVGVSVMPRGVDGMSDGGTVLGGSSLFVPVGSPHRATAVAFMEHLASDPYASRLTLEEGRLSARVDVLASVTFEDARLRIFVDQMARAHPFLLEAFPREHALFREAVRAVLQGERGAAAALADAQRGVAADAA